MTLPEVLVWERLRRGQLGGLRFRRQHPIGPYILDFFCVEAQLAVEIDGASHDILDRAAHDERRTAWLKKQGIETVRIVAQDVLHRDGMDDILATIEAASRAAEAPRGRREDRR